MSTENTTTVSEATPASKKTAKKAPAKKAVKKAVKKAPAKKETPDRSMNETPACERRAALVKFLRKAGATKSMAAVSVSDAAEKLGYTQFDVYGLVNGTSGKAGSAPNCLRATGHVAVSSTPEKKGLTIYLTAKGQKADLNDTPFVKKAAE